MGRVLISTTLAAFVMDREDTWGAWLFNAERFRESNPNGVDFFAAIEVDARGLAPFEPLLRRMTPLNVNNENSSGWWVYSLDDGRIEVNSKNRLRHLTMGQNLCMDRASAGNYSNMLFVAADAEPPADVLPKLLEVNKSLVAAHSPTYCLPNQPASESWSIPVATFTDPDVLCFSAACVMFNREAFRKLRWRADEDANMTDDPCMQHDAWYNHGWQPYLRTDCVVRHYPMAVPPIEQRGHDMRVVRNHLGLIEKYDDPDLLDTTL